MDYLLETLKALKQQCITLEENMQIQSKKIARLTEENEN